MLKEKTGQQAGSKKVVLVLAGPGRTGQGSRPKGPAGRITAGVRNRHEKEASGAATRGKDRSSQSLERM